MDKEQLKQIFIEEATEIIEQLDIKIINFEEDPTDKELLNDLFRGVHTLKGSANSFAFSKLGDFVHHFEDLLDYHRNSDEEIETDKIDLFLESVDMIKTVFDYELGNTTKLPQSYNEILNSIQKALNKEPTSTEINEQPKDKLKDLSSEFSNNFEVELEKVEGLDTQPKLEDGEYGYIITLHLDTDSYFRGFDHAVFFKLLSQSGRIIESSWNMANVPTIDKLTPQENYIEDVFVIFATMEERVEIEEIFEFLEDDEYKIGKLENELKKVPEIKEEEIKKEKEPSPKKDLKPTSPKKTKKSFVKIDTEKLDELFDSVGELVIAQNFLAENQAIKDIQSENVNKTLETLFKISKLIQNRVMSLRMVPIKDTFEKMKRVLRDSSKKVNKKVNLIIQGEDTEIDKIMVDSLSDPLIHMVRNAVDHGLEATEEDRVKAGKSSIGNVTLRAFHKGGNVAIEVSEDGRGINKEKVLNKALANGLAEEGIEYSDAEICSFIMKPGLSTADKISDISGRGVGLDVVNSSIEKLHGKVEIESIEGKGTKFIILLPLTLAIIDGMLVESAGEIFIIPILSILESFRPTKEIVHTIKGKGEFVNLREEILPIVRLNEKLELNNERTNAWDSTLVCVENEKGKFAVLVNELIGRQQVVIKPLGKALSKLKEISGGAVMGNGEIALILNIEELY